MAIGMQDEYGQTPRKGLAALVADGHTKMAQPATQGLAGALSGGPPGTQQHAPVLDPGDPGVVAAARELSAAKAYLQKRGGQGPQQGP